MTNNSLPMSQVIARQIEQMILDVSLTPKQKIPSERQLSERLGVSRAIVREALRELHGRGVIVTYHGKGSFVTEIMPELDNNDPLLQLFYTHTRTLYDLYEVREQLEGQAACLAAQRGTDEDFYRITKAFNAMEKDHSPKRAEYDHSFHRAIVEASHNAILVHILNSLSKLVRHSVHTSVSKLSHKAQFRRQIDKHHRQIYYAVIRRQGQWAQKAAAAHVRYVYEAVRAIEKQEPSEARMAIKPLD